MKLFRKIKHIKRHRANKRFAKYADDIHFAAAECFLNGNENMFIVSPRLYTVMNCRKGCVPKNIKQSPLNCDNQIITVPRDIIEFYNDNELNCLKEWYGIFHKEPSKETVKELEDIPLSQFVNPELYMRRINKPIAPDITTLNGVQI